MIMDYAGLIFDESSHYIDHLAPFCALCGLPLIVCEESIAQSVRRYYPNIPLIEQDLFRLKLPDQVVICDTLPLLQATFPQMGKIKIFWLPHGNSDKGWKSPFFEALQSETVLAYGQKMIDFLKQKNVDRPLLRIGNFRWDYYRQNESFYHSLIQREIAAHLPSGNKNYLYAPTWEDSEGNGSFWKTFPLLAEALPPDCNLLVKLHPNTKRRFEIQLEVLMGRYEKKQNLFFLPEFPPIYPLLSFCDAYIGDMSSIGYDFLIFDKPLFFIKTQDGDWKTDPSRFLYRCGREIALEELPTIFRVNLEEEKLQSTERKKIYDYTFDPSPVREWKSFFASQPDVIS